MAEVFVTEKGNITAASKRALREAGVTVVEVAALDKCQFVRASTVLSGDDMLFAALKGLNVVAQYQKGEAQREEFVRCMLEVMEAARQKGAP